MPHWSPAANELDESLPNMFLGKRLQTIRYYEFEHETDEFFGHGDVADTLDLALDLVLDDGHTICICTKSWWDVNESGLDVQLGSYESRCVSDSSCKSWDVSLEERWGLFRGVGITGVKLYWMWDEDEQRFREPGDLVLHFENGRDLFLSAGSYDGKQFFVGPGYTVTVAFDTATARSFGVGPYSPRSFKRTLT